MWKLEERVGSCYAPEAEYVSSLLVSDIYDIRYYFYVAGGSVTCRSRALASVPLLLPLAFWSGPHSNRGRREERQAHIRTTRGYVGVQNVR
jgi:hypothetical protein